MSPEFKEAALVEDVCSLPSNMQKIYLQLIAAIDRALQNMKLSGAEPGHMTDRFIEETVDLMLEFSISQETLELRIEQEFERQILQASECQSVC